jgi:hypothetical protein
MRTSVTELGDSRVRVEVGIEADAVQHRLERAAHQLARDMRSRFAHPLRIWCNAASTGEEPYSIGISLLEFLGEDFGVVAVLEPPGFLSRDVLLGRAGETGVALFQRKRSSRKIVSASTSRPALTARNSWRCA